VTDPQLSPIAPADLIAPAWFFVCWVGYTLLADRAHGRPSLMHSMEAYRRLWMRRMLERDNRIVDSQIIGNLMRSASFFASTTLIIIGGLLAALGRSDQAIALLNELPVAVKTSPLLWDLKILLLVILFVYAFFKFTWAFRHYNYCLILIGAVAAPDKVTGDAERIAARTAEIASSTARHFNGGMRAYYFGLAALSWFVHPWLFMLATAWVVAVLYRREFRSRLLATLGTPEDVTAV
jgi:uncharacterized membrane protein